MKKPTTKTAPAALPPGVKESDRKYPSTEANTKFGYKTETLTFYLVSFRSGRENWVLTTLRIGGAGRGQTERYYAVTMEGNVCRVGRGPHVKQELSIYAHSSRPHLQKYLDLKTKGLEMAGQTRDRISSRRAEGEVRRARGESYWRWSS